MIIGISGRAQTGKDTVGKILRRLSMGQEYIEDLGWMFSMDRSLEKYSLDTAGYYEIKKFAQKLKDSVEFKFPNLFKTNAWEVGDTFYRNTYLPELDMTRRELLIAEGMALRGIKDDYWVQALMQEYKKRTIKWNDRGSSIEDDYPNWIITDLRFPDELQAIKQRGGVCIRVERDDIPIIDSVSERSLDNQKLDYVIFNNGDLTSLIRRVTEIYTEIKLTQKL